MAITPFTADPPDPAAQASAPAMTAASASGNKYLDEINALSPQAKAALLNAHKSLVAGQSLPQAVLPTAAPQTPGTPSITPIRASMPPSLSAGQPSVPAITPISATPPLSPQIQADQDQLQHYRDTGSGVSQIKNPWARIPLQIADAVGSSFFPKISALLPGTELHHEVLTGRAENALKGDEATEAEQLKNQQERATTTELGSQAALHNAQAAAAEDPTMREASSRRANAEADKAEAEAELAKNPKPKTPFDLWQKAHPDGTPEDYQKFENSIKDKPLSKEQADSLNAMWDPEAKKHGLPTGQFKEGMPAGDSAAIRSSLNDVLGKQQGDTRVIIQQGNAERAQDAKRDTQTTKEYTRAVGGLHKNFDALEKQADALEEAKTLIGGTAPAQAIGQIKTLSGLASGSGSGVRITQAELNALTKARGLGDTFEGWINGLQGKGDLAKNQVKQITDMLNDVETKVHGKQQNYVDTLDKLNAARTPDEVRKVEADLMKQQMQGAVALPKGNGAVIDKASGKQFYDAAGGDPAKARQLAIDNGWKIQ